MEEIFVIERVINDIVVLENLENGNIIEVNKSKIAGECIESNVLIRQDDTFIYSKEETTKRSQFIKDLTKGLWN